MLSKERKEFVHEALSRVRYGHLRLRDSGYITLAWTTVSAVSGTSADEVALFYGLAFCAPQDNFCRATGRTIALGRLTGARHRGLLTQDPEPGRAARRGVRVLAEADCGEVDPCLFVAAHLVKVVCSSLERLRSVPWLSTQICLGMDLAAVLDALSSVSRRKPRRKPEVDADADASQEAEEDAG